MTRTYFKIAWRNLVKDRQFSVLNLAGLSTGLACTLMIWLWIGDELHTDRFNEKGDRLYQVMVNVHNPTGIETGEQTPGLLANTLVKEMPGVEYATAVIPVSSFDKQGILSDGDKRITADAQFAGKDYFTLFSYRLLDGNKNNVLADKNSVVLSRKLALKLFNTTVNIVGKSITWNQKDYSGNYIVSGVCEDPPVGASVQFDLVFSYDLFLQKNPKLENWGNNDPRTYVVLKKGTNIDAFNKKIAGLIKSKRQDSKLSLFVQNYGDRYLYNHYENGIPAGGRIEYVKLFSIIAVFILIIACINFMNLATAKAARRMKEVGIKKVMGASRTSLIFQYFSEALLMSFLSLILAGLLILLFLPSFNAITGKQLTLHVDMNFVLVVLGIIIMTGLMAGSYPALYLSGFKPVETLKGKLNVSAGEAWVRKGLVLFQFTISALFIVSVLVVYKQMHLVQTKNIGYNRENIIWFDRGGIVSGNIDDYKPGGKYEADLENFLERVRRIPGVVNAANFRHNITNRNGGTSDISWEGKDPSVTADFTDLDAGYEFIETSGIAIKEGRSFSRAYGNEKSKIIFNETAIEKMGMKNPVGKTVHLWGEDREIIGVVKDFNFQSLHENLKPCFFDLAINQRASKIMVKIQAGKEKETLQRLEQFYKEYNEGLPFEYRFLDDDYQALYSSEMKVASLSKYFAGFAIIISCLGLFGLSAFTAQRRQKEIGIRKVVGATTGNVLILLYKDFMGLAGIAVLIAFPLAFWMMNQWLNGFVYRVNAGVAPFIIAGASIFLLTLLAISFQSIKAAVANPVKSMRIE
ncbi:MAG: ABC transporter permease [Bacteroidota bacterium]